MTNAGPAETRCERRKEEGRAKKVFPSRSLLMKETRNEADADLVENLKVSSATNGEKRKETDESIRSGNEGCQEGDGVRAIDSLARPK